MKYLFLIFILFLLINCKSYRNAVTGNWKLMSVVNSDDAYAMRSSLIPHKVESNMFLTLKKDGTFISNRDLCTGNWKEMIENKSVGKYYFKKKRNPDKVFRLEASECPGIGGDHHFILKDKKLELYYPSDEGYHIQIFDRQE